MVYGGDKMAPSDGPVKFDRKGVIFMSVFGSLLYFNWVSAKLSCLIGNIDHRLMMKEYDCREYAFNAELEQHYQEHGDIYSPEASLNTTQPGTHVKFLSRPNISVAVLPKVIATNCYIYKYEEVKNIQDNEKHYREVSIHANFSCDYQNLCENHMPNTSTQIHHGGYTGELYCCNSDNCNQRDALNDLPPKQQLCYNGSSDGVNKQAAVDFCTQPDTRCARARSIEPGKEEEMYFCDNQHHCQNYSLTNDPAKQEMCKIVKIGVKKIELCCCTKNKCYIPNWLEKDEGHSRTTNPSTPTRNPGLSWFFIGGLVLMALASAAILSMVWMAIRHCRRRARENILTLTYTRLHVSGPDSEREDSQMLLE